MLRTIKIAQTLYISTIEDQDYMGQHSAPTRASDNEPIYSVENTYPQIHERGGSEYVAMSEDREGLNIILSVRNKPNARVTVYRAIPDLNKEISKKISNIQNAINALNATKEHRAIKKSREAQNLIYSLMDKYPIEKHTYDEQQNLMIEDLRKQTDELEKELKTPLKIEKGNWVTPNKAYAKTHGMKSLNNKYKIIQKTVRAKDLYTNGDSLSEWGYDPQ